MATVIQEWISQLTLMQQTTLLTAIRGPDGRAKYEAPKMLLRWYRRCILVSALDGLVLDDPVDGRGGSFTGPSANCSISEWPEAMETHVAEYVKNLDAIPSHFQHHFLHSIEILGYKHPIPKIRSFWLKVYLRLVAELNLMPESEERMDTRLGDDRDKWLEMSDPATRN